TSIGDAKVWKANVARLTAAIEKAGGTAKLSAESRASLMLLYRPLDAEWVPLSDAVAAHAARKPKPGKTKVMVVSEGVKPIRWHTQGADFFDKTYFLRRGDTNQKEEVATQGFLQVLMHSPEGAKHWI